MKHNLKSSIKLGVIILAIMVLIPMSVNATDDNAMTNSTSSNSDNAATKACKQAIFSNSTFSMKENTNDYKLTFKVKEGIWRVRVYYGDGISYDDVFTNGIRPQIENDSIKTEVTTFTIPKDKYDEQELFVVAELRGYDDGKTKIGYNREGKKLTVEYGSGKTATCRYGIISVVNSKIKINGTGAFYKSTIKPINTGRETVTLANLDGDAQKECAAMQQGQYEKEEPSDKDIPGGGLEDYKAGMATSFPLCFGGSSSFDYQAKDIEQIRQVSIDAYREYYNLTQNNASNLGGYASLEEYENSEVIANNYQLISYGTKEETPLKDILKCDKKQIEEKTEKYYVKHNEISNKNNKYCQVDCLEQIQIVYDPPVASKAGLCFQYKVTVRSKVTCEAKMTGGFDWPTPPKPCEYSAICSGNSNETQAGPNDDFDSCINSCDNGKYSQSCINKCYKKVYGNNSKTTKKTSSTSEYSIKNTSVQSNMKSNVIKLNNNGDDPYYNIPGCQTNAQINSNDSACAEAFYYLKQSDPRGKYKLYENHPSWYTHKWYPEFTPSGTVDKTTGNAGVNGDNVIESIKRAAPYYFRTKAVALKTIQSFFCRGNGKNGYGYNRCYIIDDEGIKRQKGSYNCGEVCGFNAVPGNGDNCVNSSTEAVNQIVEAFENITGSLQECSSSAKCKEDESVFDIEVEQSKEKENTETWQAKNKTSSSNQCIEPYGKDPKMFIPLLPGSKIDGRAYSDLEDGSTNECKKLKNGINGKCYGKDAYQYWQHYKTTITFPGTWIDLKTGRRYYHDSGINTSTTREKPNYYCVGWDEKPVNEKWWDWKINKVGDIDKIKIEKDNNIKAKVTKFGKYNWTFSINCFYAISNKTTTSCTGDECNTTIDNVRLRPVDQSDLFAGRTDGEIGFNWTSEATDKFVAGTSYGIDPGDYAETLQKEAKNNSDIAYTGTTDYSLHLTKENIKYLRNYAKENGYTSYKGNNKNLSAEKIDGLYYYRSNILENSRYTSKFNRKDGILGVNNEKDK